MNKMPCHITDGPSDPEDAQDPDFAEYQEEFFNERQARTDECKGIRLQVSLTIDRIAKRASFDQQELIALLKRVNRYLENDNA